MATRTADTTTTTPDAQKEALRELFGEIIVGVALVLAVLAGSYLWSHYPAEMRVVALFAAFVAAVAGVTYVASRLGPSEATLAVMAMSPSDMRRATNNPWS